MIVVARPNLTRACQFARSGDCASLEDIQTRLVDEGLDPTIVTQSEVLTKTVVDLGTFLHTTAVLKLSAGDTVDARIQFITNDGYVAANTNNFCGARVA